jgi:hypothetical protein
MLVGHNDHTNEVCGYISTSSGAAFADDTSVVALSPHSILVHTSQRRVKIANPHSPDRGVELQLVRRWSFRSQLFVQRYRRRGGSLLTVARQNEDCGQMSAWYLFSALGFYPVNPVSGEYVVGRYMFLPRNGEDTT